MDAPGVIAGVDRRAKPLLNFSAWVTNLHGFHADPGMISISGS